jgi:hypothetical protein
MDSGLRELPLSQANRRRRETLPIRDRRHLVKPELALGSRL